MLNEMSEEMEIEGRPEYGQLRLLGIITDPRSTNTTGVITFPVSGAVALTGDEHTEIIRIPSSYESIHDNLVEFLKKKDTITPLLIGSLALYIYHIYGRHGYEALLEDLSRS